jgi:hypothetical protein
VHGLFWSLKNITPLYMKMHLMVRTLTRIKVVYNSVLTRDYLPGIHLFKTFVMGDKKEQERG